MALDKQILELSVTSGLMQVADRRYMPVGHWLRLENAVSDFGGSVRKRDGYDALPSDWIQGGTVTVGAGPNVTGLLPQAIVKLAARGEELVAYAIEPTISDTLSFSWSPGQNRWIRQDDCATTSHTIGEASNIYGVQLMPQIVRVESLAGGVAYVRSFLQGTGNQAVPPAVLYVSAIDPDTGSWLIAETFIEDLSLHNPNFRLERTMTFPPALVDGYAGIVTFHIDTNTFFWTRVDPFGASIAAPVAFFTPGNPVTVWDVHELGDNRFALVHGDTVTSNASLTTWDATPAVPVVDQIDLFPVPGGDVNGLTDISVHGIAGSSIYVGWRVLNLAVYFVQIARFQDAPGLPNVFVTTVETPSAVVAGRPHYVSVSSHVSNYGVMTWDIAKVGATVLGRFGAIGVVFVGAVGAVFSQGSMVNTEAQSRPTLFGDGGWYCQAVTVTHADIPDASSVLLRLDHTLGRTPTLVGMLYRQAAPAAWYKGDERWTPVDISVFGKTSIVLGIELLSVAFDAFVLSKNNSTSRILQIQLSCEQFQPSLREQETVSLCLAATGSMVGWYDGTEEVELSFAHTPTIEEVSSVAAGVNNFPHLPVPQQWLYRAVYEWWDDEGNLHQSAPSAAVAVIYVVDTQSVTFAVQTIGATRKGRPEHGEGRPVQIAIFRTTANGQQFFRLFPVQQGIPNDLDADFVTFTDSTNDADLQSNAFGFLYTDGGTLPNTTISGAIASVVHANRLWIADTLDPRSVLYSKLLVQGEAPGFNAGAQRLRLDDEEDSITALAALDDKILIFTASSLFYVSGPGPNDTGNPQDSFVGPIRVQVDAGCIDARSILQDGDGVFFQGPATLYRVDRNLTVTEVVEVRAEMKGATVLATEQDTKQQRSRILILLGGDFAGQTRYLIHDWTLNLWTTQVDYHFISREPPVVSPAASLASAYWQGAHVHAVAHEGFVRVQGQSGTDVGAWFPLVIETPWIHLDGIAGYQRIWRATMLGRRESSHLFTVDVLVNYDEVTIGQTATWNLGAASQVIGLPLQALTLHAKQQSCTAMKLRLSDARPPLEIVVPTDGVTGFDLVALRFEVGVKPGSIRLPIQNRG